MLITPDNQYLIDTVSPEVFISAYKCSTIRLSLGLYNQLHRPAGLFFHFQQDTQRLFLYGAADQGTFRLRSTPERTFQSPTIRRRFFGDQKRIPIADQPVTIDGRLMYEVFYNQPQAAATTHDQPAEATVAAALRLTQWIIQKRPTSVFQQAEISPDDRRILKRYFAHQTA